MTNSFRLLEVARSVVDEIDRLLDDANLSLIHRTQLRSAAQSIPANIREGMGREGADRNRAYRIARGSAEETDEHLRVNLRGDRIASVACRRLHNRLALIVKMINTILP